MKLRWRWSLVVVLAAMVLGGFIPQALLAWSHTPASMTVISSAGPPTFPSGCAGASCDKGSPAAPTPSLIIAALAATVGVIVSLVAGRGYRRARSGAHALPRGSFAVLFRPPQFS
jgi:ABC-type Fe3+ transport system permease subunit